MKLSVKKIDALKNKGVTHIASVVKSCFRTTYYNVVSIKEIEENNYKWIPAPFVTKNGARYRMGVSSRSIDWSLTAKLKDVR